MFGRSTYLVATRHPWPCFLFLLPLLAAYECGVLWLGGLQPQTLRNGADNWLRGSLESFGLSQLYWAPLLIGGVFVVWSLVRRGDRPADLLGVETGMVIESVVFALGLWGLSRLLANYLPPLLEYMGFQLQLPPQRTEVAVGQVITYVGAGIYEEVLFRLLLYSGLLFVLRWCQMTAVLSVVLSAGLSAALFSAAHHVGPYGEPFNNYVFLFRMLAGLYFALLFQMRGFGIAVGAHACYDVVVGVVRI
jgi:membrane protease YdiL (CAAX protease family)